MLSAEADGISWRSLAITGAHQYPMPATTSGHTVTRWQSVLLHYLSGDEQPRPAGLEPSSLCFPCKTKACPVALGQLPGNK